MVDLIPWKNVHDVRDIVDVLTKTSTDIYELKKKALAEGDEALAKQVGRGKDILSILRMFYFILFPGNMYTKDQLSKGKYVGIEGGQHD